MRHPTDDVGHFWRSPRTSYLRRRQFVCATTDAGTLALVGWGAIDAADIEEAFVVLDGAHQLGDARSQLVDLRRVRDYSTRAMEALLHQHAENGRYVDGVAREAVVRPDGVLGAFAEGFYRTVGPPFEGRVFVDPTLALAWLGDPTGWDGADIEGWIADARARSSLLGTVEGEVRKAGAAISVGEVARRLGVSTRTLQRRLRASGTDFRTLRQRTLVQEARRLLARGQSVKEVAYELGYRCPTRLVDAFQREHGRPPSTFSAP